MSHAVQAKRARRGPNKQPPCPCGPTGPHARRKLEKLVRRPPGPTAALMMQVGRNLTDPFDGFLPNKRCLILDRDKKYSSRFHRLLEAAGIEVVRLPFRSPNLNAHAERFVRSIKEKCLDRMIFFAERSLRRATREYAAHDREERNHQGFGNRRIDPKTPVQPG